MTLTPDQLHILQHSLGCDEHGRGTRGWPHEDEGDGRMGYYRCHYVSDPTSDLTALAEAGYMTVRPPSELSGGMNTYYVTREGLAAMKEQSPKPPKLTRAQERYREYRASECNESFGEWLKWLALDTRRRKLGLSWREMADREAELA